MGEILNREDLLNAIDSACINIESDGDLQDALHTAHRKITGMLCRPVPTNPATQPEIDSVNAQIANFFGGVK